MTIKNSFILEHLTAKYYI